MNQQNEHRKGAGFPSTHWTSIFFVGKADGSAAQAALDGLLQKYQAPLLAHLQWRFRSSEHQAEDWFQGFVARKVLEKDLLGSARRERGRFRTFLLNALDNYVADEIRRENQAIRKPPGGFVTADEITETLPSTSEGASDPADVIWARAVIQQAAKRLHDYYQVRQRADLWGIFEEGFMGPILNETKPPGMAELAGRLGFDSADQASNALITAKRKFKRFLESGVAEYVEDREAVEGELRELMAILAGEG
jgi:DNA-directed RNA polymerase specialized sigma24 family protein